MGILKLERALMHYTMLDTSKIWLPNISKGNVCLGRVRTIIIAKTKCSDNTKYGHAQRGNVLTLPASDARQATCSIWSVQLTREAGHRTLQLSASNQHQPMTIWLA